MMVNKTKAGIPAEAFTCMCVSHLLEQTRRAQTTGLYGEVLLDYVRSGQLVSTVAVIPGSPLAEDGNFDSSSSCLAYGISV